MKAISTLAGLAILFAAATSNAGSAERTDATSVIGEPTEKIDINTADIPTLEAVPEIGTSFANAVVAARPFKSVYELQPILKISNEAMIRLHAKLVASPAKIPSPLATKPPATSSAPTATNDTPIRETSSSRSASDEERAEARRRHIRQDGPTMSEPPPPAREETKRDSPGPNYVWKAGHWAAVQGEWKWTPGEWAVPPTPISVWIEGTYDARNQHWSPGYWEPDKIQIPQSEAATSATSDSDKR
jgi:hypothetical protein